MFIVTIQKAIQNFFKDRTIFYSTFLIQMQARNKNRFWDFAFEESNPDKYRHGVRRNEVQTKEICNDTLTYTSLEMPKFLKTEEALATVLTNGYLLKKPTQARQNPSRVERLNMLKSLWNSQNNNAQLQRTETLRGLYKRLPCFFEYWKRSFRKRS